MTQTEGATSQKLTSDRLTEDGRTTGRSEHLERRRKSRTEGRKNWRKSGVRVIRVWVVSSKLI